MASNGDKETKKHFSVDRYLKKYETPRNETLVDALRAEKEAEAKKMKREDWLRGEKKIYSAVKKVDAESVEEANELKPEAIPEKETIGKLEIVLPIYALLTLALTSMVFTFLFVCQEKFSGIASAVLPNAGNYSLMEFFAVTWQFGLLFFTILFGAQVAYCISGKRAHSKNEIYGAAVFFICAVVGTALVVYALRL